MDTGIIIARIRSYLYMRNNLWFRFIIMIVVSYVLYYAMTYTTSMGEFLNDIDRFYNGNTHHQESWYRYSSTASSLPVIISLLMLTITALYINIRESKKYKFVWYLWLLPAVGNVLTVLLFMLYIIV